VAEKPAEPPVSPQIDLKDPVVAGVLAWLLPGLGHFYQRRYAKGVLYLVCILGTFVYGCYLGSSRQMGPVRVVYFSFRSGDERLPYLCQIGIGLPALPALVQANRVFSGKEPLLDGFMAPPRLEADLVDEPAHRTVADLNKNLARYYELGTVYTMIAGLLNVLAIYDACCGPVAGESAGSEDEEAPEEEAAEKEGTGKEGTDDQ